MISGNSKETYNALKAVKAVTNTQQDKSAVIEDNNGSTLRESTAVLNRWTEYCSGLYNYELHPDTSPLQSKRAAESLLVLRKAVKEVV